MSETPAGVAERATVEQLLPEVDIETESGAAELESIEPAPTDDADLDVGADAADSAEIGEATDTDDGVSYEPGQLIAAVEAILFVVDSPLSLTALAAALRVPLPEVAEAVAALCADYDRRGAGIEVRTVAEGVRIYTRPRFASAVEAFLRDGQRTRLSQAALETLAVVAYRQPVTRARVAAIRGVNVDGVVRTLTSRGLLAEAGTDAETGGGLLRTTELFLERMGLASLQELPSLAPLLPDLDALDVDEL